MAAMLFAEGAWRNLALHRSAIPLAAGAKHPHFEALRERPDAPASWAKYGQIPPTAEVVERWAVRTNNKANLGLPTGLVSGLIAVDVDLRHGGGQTWRELTRGHPIATETTRTPGGFHYKFRHPGAAYWVSRFQIGLPGIDLKGDGGYLVDVGSIVSDTVYELADAAPIAELPDFLLELLMLEDRAAGQRDAEARESGPPAVFAVERKLRSGENFAAINRRYQCDRYQSASERDMALIQVMVNRGASDSHIRQLLLASSIESKYQRLHQKNPRQAERYFEATYIKALQQQDKAEARQVVANARRSRLHVDSVAWTGPQGHTRKTVLLAHLQRCEDSRRAQWFLSCREGADLTYLTHGQFATVTDDLVAEGWLKCRAAKPGHTDKASQYRFGKLLLAVIGSDPTENELATFEVDHASTPDLPLSPPIRNTVCSCHQTTQFQAPSNRLDGSAAGETCGVFQRGGLGQAAGTVWECLRQHPKNLLTASEIAQQSGVSRKTVMLLCRRLGPPPTGYGMGYQEGKRYGYIRGYDFEALAGMLGMEERSRRRHERYTQERAHYRKVLATRKAEKGRWKRRLQRQGASSTPNPATRLKSCSPTGGSMGR